MAAVEDVAVVGVAVEAGVVLATDVSIEAIATEAAATEDCKLNNIFLSIEGGKNSIFHGLAWKGCVFFKRNVPKITNKEAAECW